MPVRVIVTAGTIADCTQPTELIDGIAAQFLLADRDYDSNELVNKAIASNCEVVVPPQKIARNNAAMTSMFIVSALGRECLSTPKEMARCCH